MSLGPLRVASPARWLPQVLADVNTLLLDHAHCEQKAASTVMSFVFRCPMDALAGPLSRMAREELVHFEQVCHQLHRRGLAFGPLEPSKYAANLSKGARSKGDGAMLDKLVISCLVEARSHERLQLLADAIPDPDLAALYRAFAPAEDRHHTLLLELAALFGPAEEVAARLDLFAAQEAEVITAGEPWVRMHA